MADRKVGASKILRVCCSKKNLIPCYCCAHLFIVFTRLATGLQALRKRARASMRELRRRQAAACMEARSIKRFWMTALARWAAQLVKARAAAISGEIEEFQILQQEDAEVRQ